MATALLSESTLRSIRELIDANFAGRDELYAAVETLDDEARRGVCRRLAEHLADHATELEQILLSHEKSNFDPEDVEFIDFVTERTFLELVKNVHGESRVLAAIEQCERNLKAKYDKAIEATSEAEASGILKRQRSDVEFGEQVLHTMQDTPAEKRSDEQKSD